MPDIQNTILSILNPKSWQSSQEILAELPRKVSRVYMAQILRRLVERGLVEKQGSTRGARYRLFSANTAKLTLKNNNLEEHVVHTELEERIPVLKKLPEHVHSIFTYAFSEMVNNAIEHSMSEKIEVGLNELDDRIDCTVRDFGIGVFRNIQQCRDLQNELEAIQDLLKGKTTTVPRSHSGEGIFFTSKVVDLFELTSFDYQLRIDNTIKDVFVTALDEPVPGTLVRFVIPKNSQVHLNEVFMKYTNINKTSDYAFDRTEIKVKLYTMGGVFISRSQARRILAGLEKFRSIILDFDQVPTVGQAFVDEVFRVFNNIHPEIEVIAINTNEAVQFMLNRVRSKALQPEEF